MDSVSLPYIPISLWLLAGAMTILILLVAFAFYVYWRRWAVDVADTGAGVASLAARKQILEKDVQSLREWIETQKAELDSLKADREGQERVRAVLADLEQQCATKYQENQSLRNEVGELENQRHLIAQTLEKMQREIGDLESRRAEAQALEARLSELRSKQEEAQGMIRNLAYLEAKLKSASNEKSEIEKAIEDLRSSAESARAQTDQLNNEAGQARMDFERIARELTDVRKQKAELDIGIDTHRHELHAYKRDIEQLEQQIDHLKASAQNALEEFENQVQETQRAMAEAERASRSLDLLHKDKQRLRIEFDELNALKPSMERTIEDLRATADAARIETERLRSEAGQARVEADHTARELTDVRKERSQLKLIIDAMHQEQQALEGSTERLVIKIKELEASSRNAQEEAGKHAVQARQAMVEAERLGHELTALQKDRRHVEIELGEMNARRAVLQQEISRLKRESHAEPGDEKAALIPYADLLEKEPIDLKKDAFAEKREEQDESTLLQQVKKTLRNEGLVFPSRIIDAFHTSLKCHEINPITVLAGVSGTGKTLLPVRYAEIMGMHRLVMAVQPRWDSPQDMFGFYNYLEKEYKATELSRALVRMDPYNYPEEEFGMLKGGKWAQDRLLLVLMDEMNLARTEYYFSEFLSRLELRRVVSDASVSKDRTKAEVELDAGPSKHRFRLWVGHNVFFVGTMNEDETTQTLSDKVLDRANVLRFGKPDENVRAVKIGNESKAVVSGKYLSFDQWRKWQRPSSEQAEWYEQVSQWTVRLNAALNRVGRPFGYRVLQAIGHYVANYPRVEDGERYKLAFADQVEQKIIPKIRGIDLGNESANECLSEVEAVIAELGDRELSDAFGAARTESSMVGMFQWRGVTRREEEDARRYAY